MKNKFKDIFAEKLTKEYQEEFDFETVFINMARSYNVSIFLVAIEAFMLVTMFLFSKDNIFEKPNFYYLIVYSSNIFAFSIYAIVVNNLKYDKKKYKLAKLCERFHIIYLLIMTIIISIIDQMTYYQIVFYIVGLFSISMFYYIKPKELITYFIIAQTLFLISIGFVVDFELFIVHLSNSLIVLLISIFISQLLYGFRSRNFLDAKRVIELNTKLTMNNILLSKMSLKDPLTNIANRRALESYYSIEFEKDTRNRPIALALIDIDHFKRLNDMFGHQKGDECLIKLANLLIGLDKNFTFSARYAGDEFIILISKKSFLEINEILNSLLEDINKIDLAVEEDIEVTVSIGVAYYEKDSLVNFNYLFAEADQQLYKAKCSRNTIKIIQK